MQYLSLTSNMNDIIIALHSKIMYNITYLVQDHITDERQALGFVHTGADKLAAQEELPVVPLLLFGVNRLPLLWLT